MSCATSLAAPWLIDCAGPDWEEEETYGAEIEKRSTVEGKSKSGLDSLWEDSWDDDGIEDDFSLQLRSVSIHSIGHFARFLPLSHAGESSRSRAPRCSSDQRDSLCAVYFVSNPLSRRSALRRSRAGSSRTKGYTVCDCNDRLRHSRALLVLLEFLSTDSQISGSDDGTLRPTHLSTLVMRHFTAAHEERSSVEVESKREGKPTWENGSRSRCFRVVCNRADSCAIVSVRSAEAQRDVHSRIRNLHSSLLQRHDSPHVLLRQALPDTSQHPRCSLCLDALPQSLFEKEFDVAQRDQRRKEIKHLDGIDRAGVIRKERESGCEEKWMILTRPEIDFEEDVKDCRPHRRDRFVYSCAVS